MNLIVNRQLDRAQEQVIHELTLKKRQSKKSTMSQKHLLAKQQLAHELLQERKVPILVESIRQTLSHLDSAASLSTLISSTSSASTSSTATKKSAKSAAYSSSSSTSTSTSTSSPSESDSTIISSKSHTSSESSGAGSYSDSTSSGEDTICSQSCGESCNNSSSQEDCHNQSHMKHNHRLIESFEDLEARRKEATVKFNQIRLEHLNGQLEMKLHQYEYLVAQEKALLGAYNMVLFTHEGVNNFQSKCF